jgi:hypothetical protein
VVAEDEVLVGSEIDVAIAHAVERRARGQRQRRGAPHEMAVGPNRQAARRDANPLAGQTDDALQAAHAGARLGQQDDVAPFIAVQAGTDLVYDDVLVRPEGGIHRVADEKKWFRELPAGEPDQRHRHHRVADRTHHDATSAQANAGVATAPLR